MELPSVSVSVRMCWCHHCWECKKLHYLFFHVVRLGPFTFCRPAGLACPVLYSSVVLCLFADIAWLCISLDMTILLCDAPAAPLEFVHNDELLCKRWLSLFPLHFSYRSQALLLRIYAENWIPDILSGFQIILRCHVALPPPYTSLLMFQYSANWLYGFNIKD